MKKPLLLAILFQILVLFSLLLYAYLPLYFGKEIKVRASGYDPRDFLLGNYAALSYEIGQIKAKEKYKKNQVIYLTLKQNDTFYEATTISQTKPKEGIFLKGRIRNNYQIKGEELYSTFLKFGIERYYTTEENAKKLEDDLRDKNATITLNVLRGIPRIKNIQVDK